MGLINICRTDIFTMNLKSDHEALISSEWNVSSAYVSIGEIFDSLQHLSGINETSNCIFVQRYQNAGA